MGAGHGGKSGRFQSLHETAEEFAFILWQMGVEPRASSSGSTVGAKPQPSGRQG
jgi:hypothetical protein